MNIRKITEDEVRSLWVQRLSDTPNRAGRFGTPGLTAAEIKAAYDALALRIVERYNELVDDVLSGEVMRAMPTGHGEDTLADLFDDVKSGRLAEWLTVDGVRSLSLLAAAYDSHTHDGEYAPLEGGRIPARLLPESYESAYAEAEQERTAAERERVAEEAERVAAEARRAALGEALAETMAAVEESRAALDRVLGNAEAEAEATRALAEGALGRTVRLEKRIENLRAAAEGTAFAYCEDKSAAYEKLVPSTALPYAALRTLGGGGAGANALHLATDVRLTNVYGTSLGHSDGETLTQTATTSGHAFWEGLALPVPAGVTCTVGFELYVPSTLPASEDGNFFFGLYRREEGRVLTSLTLTVSERDTWVKRAVCFTGPTWLAADGDYTDGGLLMLSYTGSSLPAGECVRFRRLSLSRGMGSTYRGPEEGEAVKTTALVVKGRNLIPLPYPYPTSADTTLYGMRFLLNGDGSLTLSGVAERNISYPLYTDADHLSLPEGEVTLSGDLPAGVELLLKTEENVRKKGTFTLTESDAYHGHYYLYFYIKEGTVLSEARVQPFLCRGGPKPPVPYRAPRRYAVPTVLTRLAGYGRAENYYDVESECFYGITDLTGEANPEPTVTRVSGFPEGGVIPVEAGGSILFENVGGDAVLSHVIFETKL
ncbi:MAG: hypothetical protein IJF73_00585 [Clostridia bacterium]|nr:hypothetical protein [Clostridia bacterium]